MSDETPHESQTDSTDADATQEIAPVEAPKSATPKKAAAKSSAKKAPAKKSSAKKANVSTLHGGEVPAETSSSDPAKPDTDKASTDASSGKDKTQVTTDEARTSGADSSGPSPLTAADYARTTKPSPSTTAVIPAVRDEPKAPESTATSEASPRRASLKLKHIEPWSVTKLAFAVSVALMVVSVVAVTIFWIVLNAAGVWDQINEAVTKVLSDNPSSFDITEYLGFGRLVGLTLVLSAINVVLMTALATIAAHLYNLASQLLGGVEVTFSDER